MQKIQDILNSGKEYKLECVITDIKHSYNTKNGNAVYRVNFLIKIEDKYYCFTGTTREYLFGYKFNQGNYLYKGDIRFKVLHNRVKIFEITNIHIIN